MLYKWICAWGMDACVLGQWYKKIPLGFFKIRKWVITISMKTNKRKKHEKEASHALKGSGFHWTFLSIIFILCKNEKKRKFKKKITFSEIFPLFPHGSIPIWFGFPFREYRTRTIPAHPSSTPRQLLLLCSGPLSQEVLFAPLGQLDGE